MELVYGKIYLNLPKIFVLKLFKMGANQTECEAWTGVCHQIFASWEVQTVKFAEECVACTEKPVLVKRIFKKGLNMGLTLRAKSGKYSP